MNIKHSLIFVAALLPLCLVSANFVKGAFSQAIARQDVLPLIEADQKDIQYVGRIDFTNPKLPRFWSPGTYVKARFRGTACDVVLNDEVLYGKSHNFVEIAVDDQKPFRVQTMRKTNVIPVAVGLPNGIHTVTVTMKILKIGLQPLFGRTSVMPLNSAAASH